QHASWPRARGLAATPGDRAVDDHGFDALRRPDRLREGRRFVHGPGVEYAEVGAGAFLQYAAILQTEGLRGQAGHLIDRGFQRKESQAARVVSQHPRKRTPE